MLPYNKMASAIYSMVNSLNASINTISDRITKLESSYGNVSANEVTTNLQATTVDLTYVEKRIEEAEKHIRSLLAAPAGEDSSSTRLLADEIKGIKSTMSDMSKDRVLLETALTHKFEQHVNRILKERIDLVTKELRCYIDQAITDIKATVSPGSTSSAPPSAMAIQEAIEVAAGPSSSPSALDIETLSSDKPSATSGDDFDIQIAQKSMVSTKRVVKKKH